MLDHVIVTVSDFARSTAFYAQALKPLGITDFLDFKGRAGHPDLKGLGNNGRLFFWLKEGRPNPDAVRIVEVEGLAILPLDNFGHGDPMVLEPLVGGIELLKRVHR